MQVDKKLETLEEELKLMKGELKQSLASVRDYLLNMELPASEFATVLAALGDVDTQKVIMKGNLTAAPPKEEKEPVVEELQEEFEPAPELEPEPPSPEELTGPDEPAEPVSELPQEEEPTDQEEEATDQEEEAVNQEKNLEPEAEPEPLLEEEQEMRHEKINAEVNQSIPKVNLLGNLITWVAKAKKEIGKEQMTILLEVYGISGHLSPELKEVILHLAEITSEQPEEPSKAEIWSQSMLSLHGILTGGDAPLYPLKPSWNNGNDEIKPDEVELIETEVEKTKNVPVKLKLVFPDGDGKGKEFCIDLTSEADNKKSKNILNNWRSPIEGGDWPWQRRQRSMMSLLPECRKWTKNWAAAFPWVPCASSKVTRIPGRASCAST